MSKKTKVPGEMPRPEEVSLDFVRGANERMALVIEAARQVQARQREIVIKIDDETEVQVVAPHVWGPFIENLDFLAECQADVQKVRQTASDRGLLNLENIINQMLLVAMKHAISIRLSQHKEVVLMPTWRDFDAALEQFGRYRNEYGA